MNFEDISFFFLLGLLLDTCILIGSIRCSLGKTADNQMHALEFPVLAYLIGLLSGIFFKKKILFSLCVFLLLVVVHYVIVIFVKCLGKKSHEHDNE